MSASFRDLVGAIRGSRKRMRRARRVTRVVGRGGVLERLAFADFPAYLAARDEMTARQLRLGEAVRTRFRARLLREVAP